MRRLVRLALAAGLATTLALPVLAESAYAKGKPAKVTLSCPTGENASGTVTLEATFFGSPASKPTPISCVAGQTSKVTIHPTSRLAPDFGYSFGVSGAMTGGCFGTGSRGQGPTGCFAGVTLTVS